VQVRTFSGTDKVLESYGGASEVTGAKRVGVVFSFSASRNTTDPLVVESDIGISFMSAEKACKFIQSEIPAKRPFEALVNATKQVWEEEVLSTVSTAEVTFESMVRKCQKANNTIFRPMMQSSNSYIRRFMACTSFHQIEQERIQNGNLQNLT